MWHVPHHEVFILCIEKTIAAKNEKIKLWLVHPVVKALVIDLKYGTRSPALTLNAPSFLLSKF